MVTLSRAAERPIALRRRRDLIVVEQTFRGEPYWIVKDPLTLRFARLREFEYVLFDALDGDVGIAELVELFESRFAPQRIKPDEVSRFVSSLHRLDLLISDAPGQGEVLVERKHERRWKTIFGKLLNPLSIRFSAVDPTRAFDLLLPLVRWMFSPTAVAAAIGLFVLAAVAIAVRWNAFVAELPSAQELLTPSNLLFVGAVLAAIKVWHEFGHGLACRTFGGECRDLGVMLLIFTPCLYCDVSDAWRFPEKRRRIFVAAAGMYFEFLLAAVAALVWAMAEPGLVSRIALTIVVVASVSTVLFNGNPLLRYDGYYILSDVVEVPNLAQRSASSFRQLLLRGLFGSDAPIDPLAPLGKQRWYLLYAICSTLYRWGLTIAIVLMLVDSARPYRLENLSRAFGLIMLASVVAAPLLYFRQMWPRNVAREKLRRGRVAGAVVALLVVVGFICFVPLPHSVLGPMELQLHEGEAVYVEIAGRITAEPVRYGAQVKENAAIARLENPELELEIERLGSKCELLRVDLTTLKAAAFVDRSAAASLAQTEELLRSLEAQLDEKKLDRDRLVARSGRDGTLYPPPLTPASRSAEDLTTWTGRPLDPKNLGCTLDVGTPLGIVGDPQAWQAAIVVDQDDVDLIQAPSGDDYAGDEVEILLDALPRETLRGRVAEIALGELRASPERLSNQAGGEVATKSDGTGEAKPASTSYLVRVDLVDPDGRYRQGWRGTAKIHVQPKTLAQRMLRNLSRTFHFEL